ncbi:MAG TPA: MSCRAMM family adhesin SdrC [Limosilactobacillus pontis]|nr:MSCRAMM family adhesin SdrC [Limosilactobacillus pontis]
MHKQLSRHIYRSSLIGLTSTAVLLALAASNATADAKAGQPTTPLPTLVRQNSIGEAGITTHEVVRTITYVDPLTKEKHTIRQVATYQFDREGQVIKSINPLWSAYFPPYFAGYAPSWAEVKQKMTSPDSADEQETVTYDKLTGSGDVMTVHVFYVEPNGKMLWDLRKAIENPDGKPVTSFTLPELPDGWEYVDLDHLPKTIKVAPKAGGYTFMIQPAKDPGHHTEHHQETKELWRKIVLHLPSGDQAIMQKATATRSVTVTDGQPTYGEWQISPFAELRLPAMASYQTSVDQVPALQLTADQLDQDPVTVEVNYQRIGGPATKDEGTQTGTNTTIDAGSQTDGIRVTDEGTQTEPAGGETTHPEKPATSDAGTQTNLPAGDEGSHPATSEEGTQTDSTSSTDANTQTDGSVTTDTGVGDGPVDVTDQGSQTDHSTTTDAGVGDDAVDTNDRGSQTDQSTGTNVGTQTEQTTSTDKESQTVTRPVTETGVGDDPAATTDQGSQTTTPPVTDAGIGSASIDSTNQSTQTDQPSTSDPVKANDKDTHTNGTPAIEDKTSEPTGQKEPIKPTRPVIITSPDRGEVVTTPKQTSHDSSVQTASIDPAAFHSELDHLQKPLRELTADPQHESAAELPQTGNQPLGIKAAVLATVTTLTAAGTAMFTRRKRH